ncbi:MAG: GH36-type glycosyl hydrolase domain-containing protein [Thiotrichales bacterium]
MADQIPKSSPLPAAWPVPQPTVLTNGRYTTLLTGAGGGVSLWRDLLLNRWSGDAIEDPGGFHIYLRDLETGVAGSAALLPMPRGVSDYQVTAQPGIVTLTSERAGLGLRLEVLVDAENDIELRRVTVTNRCQRPRRIELTSAIEVTLHTPGAFFAHPGFSKLFVQTEAVAARQALLARRRPRAEGEYFPWLVHAVHGAEGMDYETDRLRFIGRGRSLMHPLALATPGPLSQSAGNVLDPLLALRVALALAPGESRSVVFALGVAAARDEALALLDGLVQAWPERVARAAQAAPTPAAANAIFAACYPFAHTLDTPLTVQPSPAIRASAAPAPLPAPKSGELRQANGYGGFSHDGREYLLRIRADAAGCLQLPPLPWTNVVANPDAGFIASETGAGYTWARNSREHRLTPWHNDPVTDPHGEAWYVQELATHAFWSLTPGPAPAPAEYEVRHGLGFSAYRLDHRELEQEITLFVPPQGALKIARIRIENRRPGGREIALYAFARWVLGVLPEETRAQVTTEWDDNRQALLARNRDAGDFADGIAFAAMVTGGVEPIFYTADRAEFVGAGGSLAAPLALLTGAELSHRTGAGHEPAAVLGQRVRVPANGVIECAFLLGEATSEAELDDLLARYRQPGEVTAALADVRGNWRDTVGALQIETPEPALDLMVNAWLPYQNLSCRIWGRSAFYQSGGAYGFRDQLQDAAALVYHAPEITRAQILRNAAHQFVAGDVLHWWHPPLGRGIRTRFSDDLLWLPYLTLHYAGATGDWAVFDAVEPYLEARPLAPGEDEAYLLPQRSAEAGSVYEHCCRALDRSLATGVHGLPLMGTGDWNDGMNRVGREGRGESVWVGFFLFAILGDFIPLCERRRDVARAEHYREHREQLHQALNAAGWDGDWYRRAYYDNGAVLGSQASDECQIDALAQAWAVISGAAPADRAARAMEAVERLLVDDAAGIVRLLAPAFDRTPNDPGYIKGYVPGVRENGGQYTHAALWVVRALAELGRRDRAAALLTRLSPVSHSNDRKSAERYMTEPYAIAADVYGVEPHIGRGGWTWYTGSAGWMLRVAVEDILGLRWENGKQITIKPCIPDTWPGFRIRWRVPGRDIDCDIQVRNPTQCSAKVIAATVNQRSVAIVQGAARIVFAPDATHCGIEVTLGEG